MVSSQQYAMERALALLYNLGKGDSEEAQLLRSAIDDTKNTGIVLSITPDWVSDSGFDADWVIERDMIQEVANEYWECIGNMLTMYDPAEDALEHAGVPRLEDEDEADDDCECCNTEDSYAPSSTPGHCVKCDHLEEEHYPDPMVVGFRDNKGGDDNAN